MKAGDRNIQIAALVTAVFFSALSITVFSSSLPIYLARDRGFSIEAVGILVGLAFAPQVVAPLLVGPFVDRRGAALSIRIGTALYFIAALLFLVSGGAIPIGVARLLQGVGFALVVPAAYSVVPALVSRKLRGTAIGGFGSILNVALAVGPPIGIGLLQQQGSTVLFLTAVGAAAAGVVASVVLVGGTPAAPRQALFTYRKEWTPLLAVTFLTVIYWGVVIAYLPLHVPPDQVLATGWFFTADAVAILVLRIPAGFLTDRYGSRWLLLSGAIVTAAAIAVLLLPSSLLTLILSGIGTGTGAALLLPPILVELSNRSDDTDRGTAMALYTTSFAAAIAVGSLAAAPIVGRLGFQFALVLSAGLCLLAVPVIATISKDAART